MHLKMLHASDLSVVRLSDRMHNRSIFTINQTALHIDLNYINCWYYMKMLVTMFVIEGRKRTGLA